jgi:ribosomal protein S18 acetylase RimI-like enzyme
MEQIEVMLTIVQAESGEQIAEARRIFQEYADQLGVDLCFQGFERELASLPGDYAPPAGRLLLALDGGRIAGCVALRPLSGLACEMKRLYVCPGFRGTGLGRRLAVEIMHHGREIGYRQMRLDTLPVMKEAIALYRSLNFREIGPYRHNPVPGALFMEAELGESPAVRE